MSERSDSNLNEATNRITPPPAYFLSLAIENFRCFGPQQTLDLSDGHGNPRQWTILLGDNGVGKTTLLQCLAGLQAHRQADGTILSIPTIGKRLSEGPFRQILLGKREQNTGTHIGAHLTVNATFVPFRKGQANQWHLFMQSLIGTTGPVSPQDGPLTDLSGLLCYGYGANRHVGSTDLSEIQTEDTILTLFDENATLINAEEWLLQADYAAKSLEGIERQSAQRRRDRIKEVLIQLLPDVTDIRFAPSRSAPVRTRVQAQTPYGWVLITDMSLGYQTLMTWMVDFASRLFERYPESPDPLREPAIVLVDEIDLHLHPRWQRTLMSYLSDLFPNTQFIVSAHSPLVVQAATDANVVLLRREGDHVVIDNDVQTIQNWRVDQVLTSDLFGLESARPPQLDAALEERTRLLSKSRLTAKDKERLRELEAQIGSLPTGETPQDMEAMDIIRRAADLLKTPE